MKRTDSVVVRELDRGAKQRKKMGYRWLVETKIDGKRKRKFFRQGEREQLDAYATEMRDKFEVLAKADRGVLTEPKQLEMASRAAKVLTPYGKTIDDAVAHYVAWLEKEASRDNTPVSVIVKRFVAEKRGEGASERHWRDLESRLGRFERDWGETPISAITRPDISSWTLGLGLGAQSKINYRRVLHNLFGFAVRIGVISDNPVTGSAEVKKRTETPVTISPMEVDRLLRSADRNLQPALILMAFCGIRNAEVYRLDWGDIDWEDSTVEISAKNAKRESHQRHSTIPDNALAWLLSLRRRSGKICPYKSEHLFNQALCKARRDAGWSDGKPWPNNALRKTFISAHYATYENADLTAKEAGTSAAVIFKHYRKLIKKREADRLWTIVI